MNGYFKDRIDAGQRLARLLGHFSGKDVVVYALPRGGVVLGAEIAKKLKAPLDLIITRKIGHPDNPEYAIGAVAENGHSVFNKEEIIGMNYSTAKLTEYPSENSSVNHSSSQQATMYSGSRISEEYLTSESGKQKQEATRRRELYLSGKKSIDCSGKIAILVDDGIATGLTMKAAINELKIHYQPEKIIVAVAIIPRKMVEELEKEDIKVLAVIQDKDFLGSIGAYYQKFPPIEDAEVIKIMQEVKL